MKKIILLAALLLSQNVESNDEFYVFDCGRDEIIFPINSFPLGVPFSHREICTCYKRNWRGAHCDVEVRNRVLSEEIDRKNNIIINIILEGIKHGRRH